MSGVMKHADKYYRQLFSHPRMVRDLIRGFVRGSYVKDIDFSTLEPVNTAHVSNKRWLRHNDLLWKVRWREEPLFLFLMLEFQTRSHPFMALRMLAYTALLYQGLIRSGEVKAGAMLPRVLPIVLYNGVDPWTATREMAELVAPGNAELDSFVPKMRYLLIDENEFDGVPLDDDNLVSALIALENSRNERHIKRAVDAIIAGTGDDEADAALREAFSDCIQDKFEKVSPTPIDAGKTLEEISTMLEQRMSQWWEETRRKGWEDGLEQGLTRSREMVSQRTIEIARAMKAKGLDRSTIAELTGLSLDEIDSL